MPELPEVEVFRSYLAHTILHTKIQNVQVDTNRVIKSSKQSLYRLKGQTFTDTSRHGKYCFLHTDTDHVLILHFGMTGDVTYYTGDDPDHAPLIITFDDGHKCAFRNPRKLGKVELSASVGQFLQDNDIGPDANRVSKHEFQSLLSTKRGKIKSALMDQRLLSGIGNIYADEILYQTGIHPEKNASELSERQIKELHSVLRRVFKHAIKAKAEPQAMPETYLLRRRTEKEPCGLCSGRIQKITINGRGTYYCPTHQQ